MSSVELLLGSLDKDAPVREVVVGAFCTAVVLDTHPPQCGLASSVTGEDPYAHRHPPIPSAGSLSELSAKELAQGLRSPSWLQASIGMAAYNALLDVDETACVELNAQELILEQGSGRRVAIVGHFPFVDRIRTQSRECWVLELNPRPGDEPAERAGELIPRSDVVALSGTTLINHSFDELIGLCPPDAFVLLVGASAPLTPLLFDYRLDCVCGTRVVDVESVVQAAAQGATLRQIPGKKLLMLSRERVPRR